MPPVYPPDDVAKAIVRLAAKPENEMVVGGAGKLMVRQHRMTRAAVELQMALQVETTHLSRSESGPCAPPVTG